MSTPRESGLGFVHEAPHLPATGEPAAPSTRQGSVVDRLVLSDKRIASEAGFAVLMIYGTVAAGALVVLEELDKAVENFLFGN